MNKLTVSIIIPNWNGKQLLEKNLPFVIEASKSKKNSILEIIVVDDASTDESFQFLQKTYKRQIRIIKHKKNSGFASAVNTGARHAKGTLLCLLNSDVVPSKNFLVNTVSHFNESNIFAVVLHESSYGPATGTFTNGYLSHKGMKESNTQQYSFWASGGSAVFSRKLWWELGGLDADLFTPFYWEDVDLGYRAWKRGYKILWEPSAHVSHEHEGTINTSSFQKRYMDQIKERNELLFLWKNITSEKMFQKHILGMLNRCIHHPGYLRIVIMALKKGSSVLKKRRKEIKETTVSDEAVFTLFNS